MKSFFKIQTFQYTMWSADGNNATVDTRRAARLSQQVAIQSEVWLQNRIQIPIFINSALLIRQQSAVSECS